jgi:hypothetical protein
MSTWRLLWGRRMAAVLTFIIAITAGLAAGLLTPYFLAARTASIPLLTISVVASFALLTCLGSKAGLFCWGTNRRRLAATITGLLTIIFLGWLYVGVIRPSGSHFAEAIPYANTKYWQLPTGSVIAYSEYDPPQGVAVKPEAIVYLHAGPGCDKPPLIKRSMAASLPVDSESFSMTRREAVGTNDLYHVQGIERRCERAALVFGVGTGALWLITTRAPLRFLPNQLSNFDTKFLWSAIESAGVKGVFVGVIDETVTIHLRVGDLHRAQIAAVEIRPHRAEEIDPPMQTSSSSSSFTCGCLSSSHALNLLSSSFIGRRV